MKNFCLTIIFFSLFFSGNLLAKWSSKGELGIESRAFENDQNEQTVDRALGMLGRLQVDHKHKPFKERLRVYGRFDREDPGRTILFVEEAWIELKKSSLKLRLGVDLLNWTATEAFHPADIFNSRNLDSDIQNYEKIGEPMAALLYKSDIGRFSLRFMPFFIEPSLPSSRSRLSYSPGQSFESLKLNHEGQIDDSSFVPQAAFRWTNSFDDLDLSLHFVYHQDRSQPFPIIYKQKPALLFQKLYQLGGTYQHVLGAAILKLEAAYRKFIKPKDSEDILFISRESNPDHAKAALGYEYLISHEAGSESTLILEGQGLFGVSKREAEQLEVFQSDLLAGFRHSFNDINSSSLLLSVIVDVQDIEQVLASFSAERRLGDSWILRFSARWVDAPKPANILDSLPLERLRDSDYLSLNLIRYF